MTSEQISKNIAKNQYDNNHPHIWFSLHIKEINLFLKYTAIGKPRNITVKSAKKEEVSIQTGALILEFGNEEILLKIPVAKGYFINSSGVKKEFSYKCINSCYRYNEVEICIDQEAMYVKGKYDNSIRSCMDVDIGDNGFIDLIKKVAVEIFRFEKPFGLNAFPDGQAIRIIPMKGNDYNIWFKIYYTNPYAPLDYTTLVGGQPKRVYMRNSLILYPYIRNRVIEKLREFSLTKKDESNIVADDCKGVETLGSLNLQYNGNSMVFNKFYVKLSLNDRAIETYMKGVITSQPGIIIDMELQTKVFVEADWLNKRTYSALVPKKSKNCEVLAKSKAPWLEKELMESGEKYCRTLETELETMMFKWYYPYLVDLTNIHLYNHDGTMSSDFLLDV